MIQAVKLWLEPDKEVPLFQTLRWALTEMGIEEVLLTGVHPWVGSDRPSTLSSALLQRINEKTAKVANLVEHGLCCDVVALPQLYAGASSTMGNVLDNLGRSVYFVDDLDYLKLRDIAVGQLNKAWNSILAWRIARAAYPTFQELRRFLKTKDKALKLRSYMDLDRYDLGKRLSVDDFSDHDTLLISEGLPTRNFRRAAWLSEITDGQGRLRLVPEIKHLTAKAILAGTDAKPTHSRQLTWHVTRRDRMLVFRPDLRADLDARLLATQFAERWRTNEGRLCFETSLDRLVEMVESGQATVEFPSLTYRNSEEQRAPVARVELQGSFIPAYTVGSFPNQGQPIRVLENTLRECHVSTSGRKEELLRRLAVVATEQYEKHLIQLEAYFAHRRFIRMDFAPDQTTQFPVLRNQPLRSLLLAMYVLKHLRGNAILYATHENDTYTIDDLALALVTSKVKLTGAFLTVR